MGSRNELYLSLRLKKLLSLIGYRMPESINTIINLVLEVFSERINEFKKLIYSLKLGVMILALQFNEFLNFKLYSLNILCPWPDRNKK